jgi:hypothetical protein
VARFAKLELAMFGKLSWQATIRYAESKETIVLHQNERFILPNAEKDVALVLQSHLKNLVFSLEK